MSCVSFDSSFTFIRPNISPFLIRFDLGVARTAELTWRIFQRSICFAGRQNRFREPVRFHVQPAICICIDTRDSGAQGGGDAVDQQHHVPAPTPCYTCDAHSERQSALGRCARRGISRSTFVRAEATRRVERIRRRRERRRAFRAAARSRRAAPRRLRARNRAPPFSGAGADGVVISAAAREWPLLFLGCTKREWLSCARGGMIPARPGPSRPRPSQPCHSKPPSGSRDP